jgi:hypothetical protein
MMSHDHIIIMELGRDYKRRIEKRIRKIEEEWCEGSREREGEDATANGKGGAKGKRRG